MLWFFAISLFVSSSLLFMVQPMIGKLILPSLGGSPAVWNTCMVFFQAVLLVGYAYTHSLSTWTNRRRQVVVHGILLAFPFVALPFALGDWIPPAESNPVYAVLWLLLGMVGLPFFVVATSAPLLQKWFTHTGHPAAKDPYFLYGASNLGSMLALVLYPIVVEPYFDLDTQSLLWTMGYGILLSMVVICGMLVWRSPPAAQALQAVAPATEPSAPAPVLPTAAMSTAVQPAKKQRRRGGIAKMLGNLAGTPLAAPELDKVGGLRWVGLASLPLTLLLIVPFCLRVPHPREPILWGMLGGIYALGFLLFCRTRPWNWLEDTLLTFLVGQPLLLIGLMVIWRFEFHLPAGIIFVLNLVAFLLPLNFLFGLGLSNAPARPGEAPTMLRRLRWVGLAAAPSSLMLGLTTYLTTDIASIPLFWVIPLALYLLTFILVFARWPVVWIQKPHTVVLWIQPFALILLVLIVLGNVGPPMWFLLFLHTLVFFLTALVCHGELAKDRPTAEHLTEFYLWMSVGGVAGGLFNGLIAPLFFWFGVVEYPLAGVLAILLRPTMVGPTTFLPGDSQPDRPTSTGLALDFIFPFAVGVVGYLILGDLQLSVTMKVLLRVFLLSLCLTMFTRPVRAGLAVAALIMAGHVQYRAVEQLVFEDRGYFGFVRARYYDYSPQDKRVMNFLGSDLSHDLLAREVGVRTNTLMHGGINHGSQFLFDTKDNLLPPNIRRKSITYFTKHSGVGQLFDTMKWPDARLPASLIAMGGNPLAQAINLHSEPPYAVVGLGIGTLAAHARPMQHLTFYEIDPLVTRLSDPPSENDELFFYFIKDARDRGARVDIVHGDGRLTLKNPPDNKKYEKFYQVLVLDAFSSDAIPVHLLTVEAVKLYLEKLADGGVLIFNATNRYVDLLPVLADVAKAHDLDIIGYGDNNRDEEFERYTSDWVLMQRKQNQFIRVNPDGSQSYAPYFAGGLPLEKRPLLKQRIIVDQVMKNEISFWMRNSSGHRIEEVNLRWTSTDIPVRPAIFEWISNNTRIIYWVLGLTSLGLGAAWVLTRKGHVIIALATTITIFGATWLLSLWLDSGQKGPDIDGKANRPITITDEPKEILREITTNPLLLKSVEVRFADGSKKDFEVERRCRPGQLVSMGIFPGPELVFTHEDQWIKPKSTGDHLWTDKYSNVLSVLSLRSTSD